MTQTVDIAHLLTSEELSDDSELSSNTLDERLLCFAAAADALRLGTERKTLDVGMSSMSSANASKSLNLWNFRQNIYF